MQPASDKPWADMTDKERLAGPDWGFMLNGEFRKLPKVPLVLGNYGPTPFSVTLPSGEVRDIIERPT